MTFVHPFFLFALGVLAVPVLLHFLMRQKPRKLVFPALQFLQRNASSQKRSLQLRHWVLLAVRIGLVVLLVFLFARPSIPYSSDTVRGNTPTAAVFLIDTSLRMEYRFQNQTRLEAVKKQALAQLATLPAGSTVAVVTTQPGSYGFLPDASEAQQRIQNLELSAHTQSVPDALREVLPLFDKAKQTRRAVFLFSDLTEPAWNVDSAERLQQMLKQYPNVVFQVADVGVENAVNSSLEIPTDQPFQPTGGILRLAAEFQANDGVPHVVSLCMLDENGVPQKRLERTVTAAQNEVVSLDFPIGGLRVGVNQGYLELEGGDALACDNRRPFTIQLGDSEQVLLVADSPNQRARLVEQALAPTRFQQEHRARFTCTLADYSQLITWLTDRKAAKNPLSEVSAIWLLDTPPLDSRTWSALLAEVNTGTGLAIFPGVASLPASAFNTTEAQNFLPAPLQQQARHPEGVLLRPASGVVHPILRAFEDLRVPIPWDAFPVFKYWQLGTLQRGVQVIFTYSDGEPALLERSYGAGKILTMTTPPTPDEPPWNLLPQRDAWVFVVLMNGIANYLSGTGDVVRNATLTEGLSFPVDANEEKYTLRRREPDAEPLPLTADRTQRRLDIPRLETPGNYVILDRTGAIRQGFSVSVSASMSDLKRVTPEDLQALFAPTRIQVARDLSLLDLSHAGGQAGLDLFPFLAACLGGFLLVESWLANRFYGSVS